MAYFDKKTIVSGPGAAMKVTLYTLTKSGRKLLSIKSSGTYKAVASETTKTVREILPPRVAKS